MAHLSEPIELDLTDEQAFIVSVFIREGELRERERIIALLERWRCSENGVTHNCMGLTDEQTDDLITQINGDVAERRQMQMSEYGDKGETE